MKLTRFEPGDGTSYRVVFHRLTTEELEALGLTASSEVALFGFGVGSYLLPTNLFLVSVGSYLDESYLEAKLELHHPVTQVAALLAFAYLTGREVGGITFERYEKEVLRQWQPKPLNRHGLTWQEQLDELKEGAPR